ncbi:hypothetical protein BDZ90DRAFT_262897 [Jaminaea rosea]|uniref:Uncharacterized protein n=1 Tax=Jaminaea rosea TaxID=1569628 RepID=A0A316UNE1_9BASI|nr:hypothetical protein BDZ90DRAFT_262897 [Jaminaea rosea]PWN24675.1 hypothetical protein BDZ90DRAFT_262897 [Jaminaea rosea]
MTKRELKRMNEERWAREKEQRDAKWAEELALRRARGQAVTQSPPPPQSQASTSKKGKEAAPVRPLQRIDTDRTLVD